MMLDHWHIQWCWQNIDSCRAQYLNGVDDPCRAAVMGEKLDITNSKIGIISVLSPCVIGAKIERRPAESNSNDTIHDHGCKTGVKHTVALNNTFWHPGWPAGEFYGLNMILMKRMAGRNGTFKFINQIINTAIGTSVFTSCADQLRRRIYNFFRALDTKTIINSTVTSIILFNSSWPLRGLSGNQIFPAAKKPNHPSKCSKWL